MLWWIAFFNYADRQAIFSVFPILERELHLSLVQLGLLGSAFAWVYGFFCPLAGNLVDRISRKTAILGGLQLWSVICLLTALSRNFRQLFLFRLAEGLGETIYFPASMSLISDYHGSSTRSRAMGIHETSIYLGTMAGGFFAGLIGERYGWRWAFVVFGGFGMLLGLILKKFIIEPPRGAADLANLRVAVGVERAGTISIPAFVRLIWTTPTVMVLMAAFTGVGFVALVLLAWMPKFLYDKFHLTLAMSGLIATVFAQCGGLVGAPVGGWLADILRKRYAGGRIAVQAGSVILGAPFVVICGASDSLMWVIVSLSVWGLCKGIYDANSFASVFDVVPPEARGTAVGFMNLVGWLFGGGTAPLFVGFVGQRAGLSTAVSLAGGVYCLSGLLLVMGIVRYVRRDVARLEATLTTLQ
jgi:MFS family permease